MPCYLNEATTIEVGYNTSAWNPTKWREPCLPSKVYCARRTTLQGVVGRAISPKGCCSPTGWPLGCSLEGSCSALQREEGAPERIKFKSEFEESIKGLAKNTQEAEKYWDRGLCYYLGLYHPHDSGLLKSPFLAMMEGKKNTDSVKSRIPGFLAHQVSLCPTSSGPGKWGYITGSSWYLDIYTGLSQKQCKVQRPFPAYGQTR